MSPVQMWTSAPQGRPSVPTAASTPRAPSHASATPAMSWALTAASATVSGQRAGAGTPGCGGTWKQRHRPPGLTGTGVLGLGQGPGLSRHLGTVLGVGAEVGPGRQGYVQGGGVWGRTFQNPPSPGAGGHPFPVRMGLGAARFGGTVGGSPGPLPTSLRGGGLPAGIEMEIVNSCEADNGGCSHGCSHSSAGPLCTCPRGYELDEDQKTCIGARRRPARSPPPRAVPRRDPVTPQLPLGPVRVLLALLEAGRRVGPAEHLVPHPVGLCH